MITIGIDTGGTCTDAVVYDTKAHQVLSWGKTLTTKEDLKKGILKALLALDQDQVKAADSISLSTTLATNACVEGKGGRAKLVFIGVKPAVVEKMKGEYGLPPVSEICFLDGDAARAKETKSRPDWDAFRQEVRESFAVYDSVALVQINAKYNDGAYEKEAENIVREELGIPCVRGYDLYQEINVQKRGATALLNARLIPVMEKFFDSIDGSLEEMGMNLPVQIVKSDGSIMNRDYAMKRPVETLLCGPAASIIGALELSEKKDALIVDMGGTTSDVAMVRDGTPVTSQSGITIGGWKTMVKGVTIDTFALGGDTAVEYNDNGIFLEKRRVIPLCMAASQYPKITERLEELVSSLGRYSYPAHQFFLLAAGPETAEQREKYTESERKLIRALEDGPLIYEDAAKAIGISPYILRTERLENEGILLRCGVTPTDVMHVLGDYTDYNIRASQLGIEYLRRVTKRSYNGICEDIYNLAKMRLYHNLIRILMQYENGGELPPEDVAAVKKLAKRIFEGRNGQGFSFVEPDFKAKMSVIGIGAPSGIFVRDVAGLLDAEADVPAFAMVANAIGAAAGSVNSQYVVRIEPYTGGNETAGEETGSFRVTGGPTPLYYEYYHDAVKAAKALAEERACQKAREQGAERNLKTEVEVLEDHYDLSGEGNRLFLGAEVVARTTEL